MANPLLRGHTRRLVGEDGNALHPRVGREIFGHVGGVVGYPADGGRERAHNADPHASSSMLSLDSRLERLSLKRANSKATFAASAPTSTSRGSIAPAKPRCSA